MGLSAPFVDSIDIIALTPVLKILGIAPIGLSSPWDGSLLIIALQPVKQLLGIKPMGHSAPWAESLDIISLNPVNNNFQGLTQCALVPLVPTLLILLSCRN